MGAIKLGGLSYFTYRRCNLRSFFLGRNILLSFTRGERAVQFEAIIHGLKNFK